MLLIVKIMTQVYADVLCYNRLLLVFIFSRSTVSAKSGRLKLTTGNKFLNIRRALPRRSLET